MQRRPLDRVPVTTRSADASAAPVEELRENGSWLTSWTARRVRGGWLKSEARIPNPNSSCAGSSMLAAFDFACMCESCPGAPTWCCRNGVRASLSMAASGTAIETALTHGCRAPEPATGRTSSRGMSRETRQSAPNCGALGGGSSTYGSVESRTFAILTFTGLQRQSATHGSGASCGRANRPNRDYAESSHSLAMPRILAAHSLPTSRLVPKKGARNALGTCGLLRVAPRSAM